MTIIIDMIQAFEKVSHENLVNKVKRSLPREMHRISESFFTVCKLPGEYKTCIPWNYYTRTMLGIMYQAACYKQKFLATLSAICNRLQIGLQITTFISDGLNNGLKREE